MARSMLPIVFGCSTDDYPRQIWENTLLGCRDFTQYEWGRMNVPRSPRGCYFRGEAWYWCTAKKPDCWADFLDSAIQDIVILSDCDVGFFPNAAGWPQLLDWFTGQEMDMACVRQEDGTLNSGLLLVKGSGKNRAASFLRQVSKMAFAEKLPFGDQTALNETHKTIGIAEIPQAFYVPPGLEMFVKKNPLAVFCHAYGTFAGTPPQLGGEPNQEFYLLKMQYLENLIKKGEVSYKNNPVPRPQPLLFPQGLQG